MIFIGFLTDLGMIFDHFWEDVWKNSARVSDDFFDVLCCCLFFLLILAFVFGSWGSVFERYPREPKRDPGRSREVPGVHHTHGNPRAGAQIRARWRGGRRQLDIAIYGYIRHIIAIYARQNGPIFVGRFLYGLWAAPGATSNIPEPMGKNQVQHTFTDTVSVAKTKTNVLFKPTAK